MVRICQTVRPVAVSNKKEKIADQHFWRLTFYKSTYYLNRVLPLGGTRFVYIVDIQCVLLQDVAPTGHHSFFSASAGLVRAARRVCHRTARREMEDTAAVAAMYIHALCGIL